MAAKPVRIKIKSTKEQRTRGRDHNPPPVKGVPAQKRKVGRPPDYCAEICEEVYTLAESGMNDREICRATGLPLSTFYRWKLEHPAFRDALTRGKAHIDERVERSLLERATGYVYESEKIFHADGLITRAQVLEHVPADVGAATLWLKNRQPDKWRDKQEIDLSGGVTIEHREDERALALSMIQLLRTAGQDDSASDAPAAIEHRADEETTVRGPQRPRRGFE